MQKEKNMKSKLSKIILGASISFGVVSVVTVASAAFVVTGGNTNGSFDASVSVGTVTDKRLTMEVTLTESAISLDAKSGDKSGNWQWDGSNSEDLTVTARITVTGDPKLWTGVDITATGKLISDGYLAFTKKTVSQGSDHGQTGPGASITLEQELTVAWGHLFGSQNPTDYFDGSSWSSGIDAAKSLLSNMSSVVSSCNAGSAGDAGDALTFNFELIEAAA